MILSTCYSQNKLGEPKLKSAKIALAAFVSLSFCAGTVFANADSPAEETSPGITAPLKKRLIVDGNGAKQSVIIELAADTNVELAKRKASADPAQQRKAVIGALKETAVKSQAPLLETLETYKKQGRAKNVESFYILNAVAADLDGSAIKEISRRADVKSVRLDRSLRSDPPVRQTPRGASASGVEWGVKSIGARRVRDELHLDGSGVTVGIIDSGVNYTHPAIASQFKAYDKDYGLIGTDKSYRDFVSDGNTSLNDPAYNHGTHVTGTIVGKAGENNQIGVAPGAKYVAARAIGARSGDESSMLRAAEWIMKPGGRAENAPRVVNNSWGGDSDKNDWFTSIVERWRAAGIFPVFAAGNTNGYPADGSLSNPGNLPGVFSVAACDRNGKLADFSRVGPSPFGKDKIKPDICAPGVNVRSALATGGYAAWSGTSMAAPHVTGTVALMLQANPKLTVEQIEQILKSTAVPATDLRYPKSPNMGYGYGNLNAYDAVRKAKQLKDGTASAADITVKGHVLQKGEDAAAPVVEPLWQKQAFAGQSVELKAKVSDDVAVTAVKAQYRNGSAGDFTDVELKQTAGDARSGTYTGRIPASAVTGNTVQVRIIAVDYAGNEVGATDVHTIAVRAGVRPGEYSNDFEDNIDGWKFSGSSSAGSVTGDWSWGSPMQKDEPGAFGKKLLGTKVGQYSPTRQIDSYATMPPLDLSAAKGKKPALSFDEYLGFNGVSTAKIQVAEGENGKWEDLDQKLIPPGTVPAWKRVYYSLEKWAGSAKPVFVRFFFHYPDHGSGPGWYIDNIRLDPSDKLAPDAVSNLRGTVRGPGVEILWNASSANDVTGYAIYRGTDQDSMRKIATVPADAAKLSYLDTGLRSGKAVYAVRAADSFGNESKIVQKLSVAAADLHNIVNYTGVPGDNFTKGTVEGSVNDWEAGVPRKVGNSSSVLSLREAQLGLREKISAGDSVWGTNLGRPISGSDLFDARVSGQQHSYVQTPFFTPGKNSVLEFESYNAQQYLGEYQDNLSTVQVVAKDGTATTLIGADEIMNNREKFVFRWIGHSLNKYAGKEIALRFVQKTGKNVINAYELGWYLDNIRVGDPAREIKAENTSVGEIVTARQRLSLASLSGSALPAAHAQKTIPLPEAKVEIAELGRNVPVNAKDGSFSLNVSSGTWTVTAQAYGFIPQQKQVSSNTDLEFVLEKAPQSALGGTVTDAEGKAVKNAYVRVVSDANIEPVKTDAAGNYTLPAVYRHQPVTLRAFAAGYASADVSVAPGEGNTGHNFRLAKLTGGDGELIYDNGKVRTNVVHTKAGRGVAVRFYPGKVPASLTGVKLYVADADKAEKKDVKLLVLAEDADQRMQTLAELDSVALKTGWNYVDLAGYSVKIGGTFYVAVVQKYPGPDALGVAVDTQGTNSAAAGRTYLYNGDFVPAAEAGVVGAAMLRAQLHYGPDALAAPAEPRPGEPSVPEVPKNPQDDFQWDVHGDHVVLKKYTGQAKKVNVPAVWVNPATGAKLPVTGVAANAFAWKYRESITLPEGITDLEPGAFTFAVKKDGVLHIPSTVKELKPNVFSQMTGAKITGLAGISKVPADAFKDTHGATVELPNAVSVDPNAFRSTREVYNAEYNKVITAEGNPAGLTSVDGQYLVNPAQLEVNVEIVGTEKTDQTVTYIGPGNSGNTYPASKKANEFYRVGQSTDVDAPRNMLVSYLENTKKVTLSKPFTKVTFFALNLKGEIREPLFAGDTDIVGLALAEATADVEVCGDGVTDASCTKLPSVKTGRDGSFSVKLPRPLALGQKIKLKITDKHGKSYAYSPMKAGDRPGSDFLMESNSRGILLRYLGAGGAVDFPASAPDKNGTVRPVNIVGSYALANRNLTQAANLGRVGTLTEIKAGAFAGNALKTVALPVNLREIGPAAFAGNVLESLTLPNLMHKIGDGAFAGNRIANFTPGKYTAHYGNYAFAQNMLRSIRFGSRIEDLGRGAFANNRLTSVDFDSDTGSGITPQGGALRAAAHQGLTRIAEETFAHNDLTEVTLPVRFASVAADAFAANGRFVNLLSDNEGVKDSILGESSGHIVNGADITVRFTDTDGKQIRPDSVWVGQNLTARTGSDLSAFYRIGKQAAVSAPEIGGYHALRAQVTFTAKKAHGTVVELKYQKDRQEETPGGSGAGENPDRPGGSSAGVLPDTPGTGSLPGVGLPSAGAEHSGPAAGESPSSLLSGATLVKNTLGTAHKTRRLSHTGAGVCAVSGALSALLLCAAGVFARRRQSVHTRR